MKTRVSGYIALAALVATVTTACSQPQPAMSEQALAEQAKKDGVTVEQERFLQKAIGERDPNYKCEGYSEKLVPAKLGPNTFMFPMNLYDDQIGPDFQRNFALEVRWPGFEAFPPGAIHDEKFRMEYIDASIHIAPTFLSKVRVEDWLNITTTRARYEDDDDPRESTADRIKGDPVFGLQPYYIDMARFDAYMRRRGLPIGADQMNRASDDWYLAWDDSGRLQTVIKCDPRELKGASLIDGQLELPPIGTPRGLCHHMFVLPQYQVSVNVTYLRAYLRSWAAIEKRVRDLFEAAAVH